MLEKEIRYILPQPEQCCGCSACSSACPKNAITMVENSHGFKYPVVDEKLCVNCGLCKNVCDFQKESSMQIFERPLEAYAIKHKDEVTRAESRSGGAFTSITDYILDNGGCVFGAALDEDDYTVHHIMCSTKEERNLLRGSKYVQSDMREVFNSVETELKTGRLVAFSGTACQVAGLKSFLRKDYDNLYTFDIVCHGVPSPKVFRDYVLFLQKKFGKIKNFNFRDKSILGWDMHFESYIAHGIKRVSRDYSMLFYSDYTLRESCFCCKYASIKRPGDFTLADFWGCDAHFKGFNDNKGVSLLLVNSEKAKDMIAKEDIRANIEIKKCSSFEFVHPNMKRPTPKPADYDEFWKYYEKNGISKSIKKYSKGDLINKLMMHKSIILIYLKRKIFKTQK